MGTIEVDGKEEAADSDYIVEDGENSESSNYGSDLEFFLDGDNFDDTCNIIDNNNSISQALLDPEYMAYCELISDDFNAYKEHRNKGVVLDSKRLSDVNVIEVRNTSDDEKGGEFLEFNEERESENPKISVVLVFRETFV